MKDGYKILWTDHALEELEATINYLKNHFSDKEIKKLAERIESITELIARNPDLFSKSEIKGVHQVSIMKLNTMYYRVKNKEVHIISFFSNRQSPRKLSI